MPTLTVKIAPQISNQNSQSLVNKHFLILLSLLMSLTGCSFLNITPTPPIKIPIALHKAGSVAETEVRIAQDDRIALELWFFVNDQPGDRDRLLDFLGRRAGIGVSVPQAVTVPLKIKIIKLSNTEKSVVLDKTYSTTGLSGISQPQLSRLIDELSIKSGTYRIQIETIEDFPELLPTPVQFWIRYIRAPK